MLEIATRSKAPAIGAKWLSENVEHAVVGLVLVAAGRGALAEAAASRLADLKRAGHGAVVDRAAKGSSGGEKLATLEAKEQNLAMAESGTPFCEADLLLVGAQGSTEPFSMRLAAVKTISFSGSASSQSPTVVTFEYGGLVVAVARTEVTPYDALGATEIRSSEDERQRLAACVADLSCGELEGTDTQRGVSSAGDA